MTRAYWLALALLLATALLPARAGFIRDAEIERLLADYSRPLLLAAGLNPETVNIGLINAKSLNAFVAGGQNMFFHTGLITEAEEPNMIIGVIAHEIGHITGGHLSRTGEAVSAAQGPAMIATILGLGSIIAGAPDVGMALIAGGAQVASRSFLSYSRAQEASADVTALRLLEATQQSPRGIINMMETLAEQEVLNEVSQDPYARSHPLSRARVNAYIEGAGNSPFMDTKDSEELQFRHDMAKAKLYGFLDHPQLALRRYADASESPPAIYASAVAYHRLADLPKAIELIDQLLAQFPENAWIHELKGQIYYEAGYAARGLASYERAVSLVPDEPLLLIGLATCQIGVGSDGGAGARGINKKAEENLRHALRLDPQSNSAWFQLAKAYGQLNEPAYANWALAEYYALQNNPDARKYARRALKALPRKSTEFLRARDIMSIEFPSRR